MKYLIIFLMFLIAGCSVNDAGFNQYQEERVKNVVLQSKLNACEAKLDYSGGSSTLNPDPAPEEQEQPAEPQCNEVDSFDLYQEGKLVASCLDVKETACGINAEQCANGYSYNCLTNVKFKSETKKVCN